jgi:ubiquinone/menaquinone biosynthesis C-methylase UbiE
LGEQITYIHGTHDAEQARLAELNRMTNPPFLAFLELNEADTVLEVGSGLGLLAEEVARRAPSGAVVGVEFSAEQLERTHRSLPNLRFVRGDAHHLPFETGHFDVVYGRYVLEHLQDPLQTLREMRRVLRPGGRAFAQENNMQMVAFDPDCPAFEALLEQFIVLQSQLGGDGRIGKRLFSLFHRAGFQEIVLSYQPEIHPANQPTFRPWVENCIHVVEGVRQGLLDQRLASEDLIRQAIAELRSLLPRDDASALFHWNRATGIKGHEHHPLR